MGMRKLVIPHGMGGGEHVGNEIDNVQACSLCNPSGLSGLTLHWSGAKSCVGKEFVAWGDYKMM